LQISGTYWLYLAAGGFWVGGHVHRSLAAPAGLARLGVPGRGRAVGRDLNRFTRVAVPGVVVVSLFGLNSSWIHRRSNSALSGALYGGALLVKLPVAPMLLFGATSSLRYGPRAARPARARDEEGLSVVERGFFPRSVKLGTAFGVLVLLTALLVLVTPGGNDVVEAGGGRAEQNSAAR
jgi:putative copper export protein